MRKCGMADREAFTIEILGFDHDHAVVVDRVIGGSRDLEEAKRIGHHLFCIADEEMRPEGYRILSEGREVFACTFLFPGPRCTGRDGDGRRRVTRSDADCAA
jgi:hypothetical protein